KAIQGEIKISTENGETRTLRSAPDWGETAINGDHLWVSTSASGDLCYVGENECSKQGPRLCCPACKITAHTGCIGILIDKIKFHCKPTFKDVGIRQYREQTVMHHHWVHRRHQKGRCRQCVALSCSWCKVNFHNKETCFCMERLTETCNLGIHSDLIIPPSWIVKLPRKGSFKSSIRRSPKNKRSSSKRRSKKEDSMPSDFSQHLPVHPILPLNSGSSSPPPDTKSPINVPGGQHRSFTIKPIPSPNSKPLLVFINPKSGGNQGSKLMQKFQWLLNPRQVFDLTQGGPRPDEPVSKILLNIQDGEIVQLDRWDLKVFRNNDVPASEQVADTEGAKDVLPLNVVNNYFSIGVDAHIALEFHEAREAHPERFNSRLRNKMFYGQAGGKDLLQRKWKDLCNYITLECDGVDLTQRLRDLKIHSLLFLNIPSYGGGTRPWGTNSPSFETPRTDDGLIEVIGLTTYQLAGGHGSCIAQCRSARIITSRTIPMQVDGEPCRLLPSLIELQLRNQANMIAKSKSHSQITHIPLEREVTVEVRKLNLSDYETYHYDKEKLKEVSLQLGKLTINPDLELDRVRAQINEMVHGADHEEEEDIEINDGEAKQHHIESQCALSADWCFVDSCTAERFFRIDRAQEHLHYVVDICNDDLFILDPADDSAKDESSNVVPNIIAENPTDSANLTTSLITQDNNKTIVLFKAEQVKDEMDTEGASDNKTSEMVVTEVSACGANNSVIGEDANRNTTHDSSSDKNNGDGDDHNVQRNDQKADPSLLRPVNTEKISTEIIDAAREGDLQKIKNLLRQGYSVLAIDENGMTALHYAAKYGYEDIVQLLIQEEPSLIDIPDCDEGQTALHKAAKYSKRKVCCILAAAGSSLSKLDNQGYTPKQLAIASKDEELAAYLQRKNRL
ncbi:eye-specific diacylglycerol kinase-like protein, partial [Dinothrombium tinctorium]